MHRAGRWVRVMTLVLLAVANSEARAFELSIASNNGLLEFSDFEFWFDGVDPNDLTLHVLDDGIQITGPLSLTDGDSAEFYVRYMVTAYDGFIDAASLLVDSQISGDGFPTFVKSSETLYDGPPGPFVNQGTELAVLSTEDFELQNPMDSSPLAGMPTVVTVVDGVRIRSGGTGDEAAFFSLTNTFLVVPEPATSALFGVGLVGLGILGRRSKAS